MSFLAKRLAPGESLVYRGRFHVMQQLYAWGALLLLGIILVGVYIWVREMVRLNTTEFLVTNRRVMLKTGWLSVHVDEITLGSIEGGEVDESILGRLFGYGRLTMRGRGDTHLLFPTMAAPNAFRSAAEGARIAEEGRIAREGRDVPSPSPSPLNRKPLDFGRSARKRLQTQGLEAAILQAKAERTLKALRETQDTAGASADVEIPSRFKPSAG